MWLPAGAEAVYSFLLWGMCPLCGLHSWFGYIFLLITYRCPMLYYFRYPTGHYIQFHFSLKQLRAMIQDQGCRLAA